MRKIVAGLTPFLNCTFTHGPESPHYGLPRDLRGASEIKAWIAVGGSSNVHECALSPPQSSLQHGMVACQPPMPLPKGQAAYFIRVRFPDGEELCGVGMFEAIECVEWEKEHELPKGLRDKLCVSPYPQRKAPPGGWGHLKAVIMAWPRSGTNWLTSTISSLGIECGHEAYFEAGPKCNATVRPMTIDVSGFVAPFTDALGPTIRKVLVVRHPQRLFGSILKRWDFEGDDVHEWICARWAESMKHMMRETRHVWRIEDLWARPELVLDVLDALRIPRPALEQIPDGLWEATNRGPSSAGLVPAEKISDDVWALAKKFWYEPLED